MVDNTPQNAQSNNTLESMPLTSEDQRKIVDQFLNAIEAELQKPEGNGQESTAIRTYVNQLNERWYNSWFLKENYEETRTDLQSIFENFRENTSSQLAYWQQQNSTVTFTDIKSLFNGTYSNVGSDEKGFFSQFGQNISVNALVASGELDKSVQNSPEGQQHKAQQQQNMVVQYNLLQENKLGDIQLEKWQAQKLVAHELGNFAETIDPNFSTDRAVAIARKLKEDATKGNFNVSAGTLKQLDQFIDNPKVVSMGAGIFAGKSIGQILKETLEENKITFADFYVDPVYKKHNGNVTVSTLQEEMNKLQTSQALRYKAELEDKEVLQKIGQVGTGVTIVNGVAQFDATSYNQTKNAAAKERQNQLAEEETERKKKPGYDQLIKDLGSGLSSMATSMGMEFMLVLGGLLAAGVMALNAQNNSKNKGASTTEDAGTTLANAGVQKGTENPSRGIGSNSGSHERAS